MLRESYDATGEETKKIGCKLCPLPVGFRPKGRFAERAAQSESPYRFCASLSWRVISILETRASKSGSKAAIVLELMKRKGRRNTRGDRQGHRLAQSQRWV
jgi:hypothetical protein